MIRNDILPVLGDRKVADVHYGDVKALHEAITKRGTPVRANRVLAVASKMFALSLLPMAGENAPWRNAAQGNPCKGVKRNQEEGKERFFSAAEIAILTDAIEAYGTTSASNCLRLMMLTGCRPGEAMRATWAEFADAGFWDKPSSHTKQQKRHRVPLSPAATKFIEQIREKKIEGGGTAWDAITDKAGVGFVFPGQKKGTACLAIPRPGRRSATPISPMIL
jgi:integrase